MKLPMTLLVAVFAAAAGVQAGTHLVPQGRAGYIVCNAPDRSMKSAPRETNVALVMEKPREAGPCLQNMGRAGYQYTRAKETARR